MFYLRILLVPNDPLSAYSDIDRWMDRPNYYSLRNHDVFIFPTGKIPPDYMGKLAEKNDIDIIRVLEGGRWILSASASQFSSVPVVSSIHGDLGEISRARNYEPKHLDNLSRLQEIAYMNSSRLLPVQKSYVRYLDDYGVGGKTEFLPNYVDLDLFRMKKRMENNRVLYVGRFDVAGKDIDALLECARNVDSSDFVFVGKGPMRDKIKAEGHTIVDPVTNELVASLINQAAVVFYGLNGITGFPIPVMEAQACGRPVVLCRRGFSRDYLEEYEPEEDVEYFMDPENLTHDPKQMAERIDELLSDDNLWRKTSREGRIRMEQNFERERLLNRDVKIMEEVHKEWEK